MKKKIVFLHPPLSLEKRYGILAQTGYTAPPFGLCYLAAGTRKNSIETSIIDAQALNLSLIETVNRIIAENPDYLGITITTQLIYSAGNIAEKIKRINPNIKIIVGGSHITALPDKTMIENPFFDYGVIGEGEITLIELIEALNNKHDLNLIKDIDSLPFPAIDLLPKLSKYYRATTQTVDRLPSLLLITSRGCPSLCSFCDNSVHGHMIRAHSAEYVVDYMTILREKYHIKSIFLYDDNSFVLKNRLIKIMDLLKERKLDITWSCMARVDNVDFDILKKAKQSGCWQINFGIETVNQDILNLYNKNITPEKVVDAVNMAKRAGLKVKGFIMLGNPLETKESIEKTIDFTTKINLDDLSIAFFTPYPGASIYNKIEKYGSFNADFEKMSSFDVVFVPKGLTEEDLWYYSKYAYFKFYFRPKIILSYILRIKSFSQFKELFFSGLILIKYIFKAGKEE